MTHAATQAEIEKALELASKATTGPWSFDGHTVHRPYSVSNMLTNQAIKKAEKKRRRRNRRAM